MLILTSEMFCAWTLMNIQTCLCCIWLRHEEGTVRKDLMRLQSHAQRVLFQAHLTAAHYNIKIHSFLTYREVGMVDFTT